ncbi:MAG: hypothetical protein GY807_01865 [Gammaproteobacteria bacterium]|nr:hypothetical protein [Gammaproteobacteria bacterium]
MAKQGASTTEGTAKELNEAGGHAFPFESRGMTDTDRSTHVWVGFNIPTCLYLDSQEAGGLTIQSSTTRLDFKHVVNPRGRCGMPVQMIGAEIENDDKGNYTYTSVSACIPFQPDWSGRDYVAEAIRAVNETIIAYREVAGRPTIATLGPSDLSQGLTIEGPFPNSKEFLKNSGLSGVFVSGNRPDGTPMLSMKGFVGGWGPLQHTLGPEIYAQLQEYLSGSKKIGAARRVLQEALRELQHGDFGFAAVLGGSALEIGIQELLDRKSWQGGSNGTFANKFFVDPFVANGETGFNKIDSAAFTLVERLYKVRNKVAHEGKAYYMDNAYEPVMTLWI